MGNCWFVWSKLESEMSDSDEELNTRDLNRETFEMLRKDPKFKDFFSFTFPDLKVGRKFAEGGKAEIYEGEFTLGTQKFSCVLKIFKEGTILRRLQEQWPQGMLKGGNSVFPGYFCGTSSILGGVLLPDGRFAIVLKREWGDLRTLIELSLRIYKDDTWQRSIQKRMHKGSVFSYQRAKKIMLEIAIGMQKLHNHGILHRDLKTSNVLVSTPYPKEFPEDINTDPFHVKVSNFESSVGVVGTGLFRAPEILLACKERKRKLLNESISTKSDVYGWAMTCYEILTGHPPFEEHLVEGNFRYFDIVVLEGGRPELPHGIDEWLRELIEQCWHQDPSKRPEFKDIIEVFKANFSDPRIGTVQERIAASTSYWTLKDESEHEQGVASTSYQTVEIVLESERKETNQEIFARLKRDSKYGSFFSYNFHNLELKLKIAQGGQGEIYEAEFEKENGLKVPCVVKIFDSKFSLQEMVKQWPPGMFKIGGDHANRQRFGFMGLYPGASRTCEVLGAVVFEDSDSFAFIFNREGGDLRTLIDLRKKQHNHQGAPFTTMLATKIMHEIALGMQYLHDNDILHRDLKAANVLVTDVFGEFPTEADTELMDIKVADFECSMLVDGTRFWRAPEILKQLKSANIQREYTQKADVYSYGMTCYEVLTGGVPLDHLRRNDYEAVYRGERPILHDDMDAWLRALIERCWAPEPSERPEFKEIIEELQSKCPHLR